MLPAGAPQEINLQRIWPGREQTSHRTAGGNSSQLAGRAELYYFREKNEIPVIALFLLQERWRVPSPGQDERRVPKEGELITCGDLG